MFDPTVFAQPGAPGPCAQPHQFSFAPTRPPLARLSTPVITLMKLFRCTGVTALVLAATAIDSCWIVLPATTVPEITATGFPMPSSPPETLMPVGPGVK